MCVNVSWCVFVCVGVFVVREKVYVNLCECVMVCVCVCVVRESV